MPITFEPLNESHFPLLLKWLESPHVQQWWDKDVIYTMDLVKKFGRHCQVLSQIINEIGMREFLDRFILQGHKISFQGSKEA